MKSKFIAILFCLSISSCANKMTLPGNLDIQLVPEKGTLEKLNNIKVSYILPLEKLEKGDIDALILRSAEWGKSDSRREKIISSFNDKKLQVERRVDNGVAGSGLIYTIDIVKEKNLNTKTITFNAKTIKTYQDGLILPFPLPKFDLASYLESATVVYKFEIISEYPDDSIRANFKRMLNSNGSRYEFNSHNFSSLIKVEIYPYRKGSKVMIESKLFAMKPSNNIINIVSNIKELESRIKNIVND